MSKRIRLNHLAIIFALLFFAAWPLDAFAQQPTTDEPAPAPSLVRPTVLSRPLQPAPDIAQPPIPTNISGLQGMLVETLDGRVVAEQAADQAFNPASAVKLAISLVALHNFGVQHRFITAIWTDGSFDAATGTINGNLIISGRDPSFHFEHAVMVARELNRLGIRTVTGDLVVPPKFTMNFDWSAQGSGNSFYDTLDDTRRSAQATEAWRQERITLGDTAGLQSAPSVTVMGAVYIGTVPANARMLLVHRSSTLPDILKVLLCYSNNFMAERIGDNVGGPEAVRRYLINNLGIRPDEVRLASTSGLGVNRVTPRAMMKIYRALSDELAKNHLQPSDILPVAGIDPGTLEKRFTEGQARGSVIAKTGTLVRTDGGASALVGQMNTASGETLLFVIFNQRGNVMRFRQNQDALVTQLQNSRGGPAPFQYRPQTLAMRLANTESESAGQNNNEYEPAP
ncbi:MAG TPA: D-alanyl-D-alanine carboxypeptidase [Pyrinomonadaceae bacterium]|nr:D-alanyl-D-alanine carboxypeptidase [Pyrinomonadaceae bacterium]